MNEQATTVAAAIAANWDSFEQFSDTVRDGVAFADIEAIDQEIAERGFDCSIQECEDALLTICRDRVAAESVS